MRGQTLGKWVLFVLAMLVCLVWQLPATLLGGIISNQTQGMVKLALSSGTIWHGSAQPVVADAALSEPVSWDWQASDLLRGRLGYKLTMSKGGAEIAIGLNGEVTLSNVDISIPAAPLFKASKTTKDYGLTGQLHMLAASVILQANQSQGQLTLNWANASTNLIPSINPLGDYRLMVSPAGNGWRLQLTTVSGKLLINGTGNWHPANGFSMNIKLRAAQGYETYLYPFLSFIGPGEPDTEREIHL